MTPITAEPNRFAAFWARLAAPQLRWLTVPLLVFVVTRGVAVLGGVFGAAYLPEPPSATLWHLAPERPLLDMWIRWDSDRYLEIANVGYTFAPGLRSPVAFFPLYPLLIRWVGPVFGDLLAGVLVSNAAFLGALIALYRLAEAEFGEGRAAAHTLWYLALAPTALFFSALYTEGLFLLLSVLTFYAARRRRWVFAGLLGLLAAQTRLVGVLLWGAAGLEWLAAHGWTLGTVHTRAAWLNLRRGLREDWRGFAAINLIPLGLLVYMLYLWLAFGDPVAFNTVQAAWDVDVIGLGAALREAVGGLLAGQPAALGCVPWDLAMFAAGVLFSAALWRKLGASYALYGILSALTPMTRSTQSMARYAAVIFPLYMMLAWWTRARPRLRAALWGVFGVGLFVFMALFSRWYFVG